MKGKEPEKNIIVFSAADEKIYNKYLTYFQNCYSDLIKGQNLIFQGTLYELKKATEL